MFSPNAMLSSSGNQYLRPEYLSPLPTTLDAKKSPLALLAQTCSQIGADSPSKLIAPLEKHKKGDRSEREKASPASSVGSNISAGDNKSCFKPYDMSPGKASPEAWARTPNKPASTPVTNQTSSRTGSHSASPRSSPRRTPADTKAESKSDTKPGPQSAPLPRSVPSPPSKSGFSPSHPPSNSDPLLKDLAFGSYKPGAGLPLPSGLLSGYPPPMDLMASSFLSPHALKSGLNPYLNYARLKGGDALMCRDPYCTGCQLPGKPPCPGGCVQCEHTSKSSFLPTGAAAAAYAHAQLAALAAASQLPYVCNWIAGDSAYCGKRFSNSDELLQHLKTHTNGTAADSASAASMSLLNSPSMSFLHRTYPTPPLSPLASARYHPYSKSPLFPPSLSSLGFPMHPHPSLSPYLSPYALYGQRLGASSMHP